MATTKKLLLQTLIGIAGVLSSGTAMANSPDFQRCAQIVSGPLFAPQFLPNLPTKAIKRAIFRVGDCARSQVVLDTEDNSPVISQALLPLFDELGRRQADVGLLEKVSRSTGVWQNVWNDLPNVFAVADAVYQVVTPNGFYWNISKAPSPFDPTVIFTSLLRGRYEPNNNGEIDVFFTTNLIAPGFPREGTPLTPIAELAETGLLDAQSAQLGGPGPFVPELASGQLETVYIDDNFRLIRGDRVGPAAVQTLFVLVRQPNVSQTIRLPR